MRPWLPAILTGLFGLSALLSPSDPVTGAQAAGAAAGEVPIGHPLRQATLQGLNGPPVALSTFRGQPLLINVWASWCGPCREETASLERLAWLDAGRKYAIIGISTDDYVAQAKAWLGQSRATISHYIDHELEMEHMLGASRLPLTVLVDADGRVLQRIYGAREWDSPASLALIRQAFGRPARLR
jgi:thiol-disulfide isomerase/thioredoxin